MDRARLTSAIAPAARIQRDTRAQREFLARSRAHTDALHRGVRGEHGNDLEARLARLRVALLHSPAHRDRLRRLGLSPHDLRTLEDLRHFPTLPREELARSWESLPALELEPRLPLGIVRSSGTSGDPVQVVRDAYDNLHMWSVLRFWLEHLQLQLRRRPRVVLLDALPGGLEYSVRVPLLDGGALHRISVTRPEVLARLIGVEPAILFSDPAGLHWLLAQDELPRPSLLLTSAQLFPASLRSALAARLASPVVDYYATTETGPIAWACLRAPDRFHALAPDVHLESIDGELAITRLRESVLPLLRYLPGDRGEVVEERCSCGFVGQTLLHFSGRRACSFVLPDGRRVDAWSLAWVFKHHPLRAFQLVQTGAQGFVLRLDGEDDPGLQLRLARALVQLGFPDPELRVERGALPPTTKPEPFRVEL